MKKYLSFTLFMLLAMFTTLVSSAHPTFAAISNNSDFLSSTTNSETNQMTTTQVFDLSELSYISEREDGTMPFITIPENNAVANGETRVYSKSDGNPFYISAGTIVTFTVKLNSSAHVIMGYQDSNGVKHPVYNNSGKTNTTTIYITDNGNYRFYITNVSSDVIQISGGSITF